MCYPNSSQNIMQNSAGNAELEFKFWVIYFQKRKKTDPGPVYDTVCAYVSITDQLAVDHNLEGLQHKMSVLPSAA